MDIKSILGKPGFSGLEPERIEAFTRLAQSLEGKSRLEAIAEIIEFAKNQPKGRELSKEEQKGMIQALTDSMSEEERKKYEPLLKMIK